MFRRSRCVLLSPVSCAEGSLADAHRLSPFSPPPLSPCRPAPLPSHSTTPLARIPSQQLREDKHNISDYTPAGRVEDIPIGAYYLAHCDGKHRRVYKVRGQEGKADVVENGNHAPEAQQIA